MSLIYDLDIFKQQLQNCNSSKEIVLLYSVIIEQIKNNNNQKFTKDEIDSLENEIKDLRKKSNEINDKIHELQEKLDSQNNEDIDLSSYKSVMIDRMAEI